MTSRERVIMSLNHQKPGRVPVDIGGSDVTGIHVTALDNLRKALRLERNTVKAFEPMMPRIEKEMPAAAEKLKMLEIDNIEFLTKQPKEYFKSSDR